VAREKVVLAYSGGLDTSVAVKWINEKYDMDVITYTCDLGQGRDVDGIRKKRSRRVPLKQWSKTQKTCLSTFSSGRH